MLSYYQKLIFSPIALYGLEDGGQQLVDISLTTKEYADQLSDDGVDATDIRAVLDRLDTEQSGVVEEAVFSEVELGREIITSMLQKLGGSIAEGDMDGVFQQKWASGRLVFDDYAGFGGTETSVLSTATVERIVQEVGLTEDEIISALSMGNEEYAKMIADMLMAGQAQRGPDQRQVKEMNRIREAERFIEDENLLMSQDILSPELSINNGEIIAAETTSVNPHPDIINEFTEAEVGVQPGVLEGNEGLESISDAHFHMLGLLKNGEGKVRFSEIKSSSEATTSLQTALIEKLGINEIQSILNRADMTADKFVDGDYGNWTKKVVSVYQTANGLTIDGEAGTQTFASMIGLDYDASIRVASLPIENDKVYANNDGILEDATV